MDNLATSVSNLQQARDQAALAETEAALEDASMHPPLASSGLPVTNSSAAAHPIGSMDPGELHLHQGQAPGHTPAPLPANGQFHPIITSLTTFTVHTRQPHPHLPQPSSSFHYVPGVRW